MVDGHVHPSESGVLIDNVPSCFSASHRNTQLIPQIGSTASRTLRFLQHVMIYCNLLRAYTSERKCSIILCMDGGNIGYLFCEKCMAEGEKKNINDIRRHWLNLLNLLTQTSPPLAVYPFISLSLSPSIAPFSASPSLSPSREAWPHLGATITQGRVINGCSVRREIINGQAVSLRKCSCVCPLPRGPVKVLLADFNQAWPFSWGSKDTGVSANQLACLNPEIHKQAPWEGENQSHENSFMMDRLRRIRILPDTVCICSCAQDMREIYKLQPFLHHPNVICLIHLWDGS